MATSAGQPLVQETLRLVKFAVSNIRIGFPTVIRPIAVEARSILFRNIPRHPLYLRALGRHGKQPRTWFAHVRSLARSYHASAPLRGINNAVSRRGSFPKSKVGSTVRNFTRQAPFASTLRPNLTGGAFPRTASGYAFGSAGLGGPRYFSHMPASPAEVVNNVSVAVRAFWLSGQRARFDGVDSHGAKRYRAVTSLEEETSRKLRSVSKFAPGSYIDFHVSPTLTSLGSVTGNVRVGSMEDRATLNAEGFLSLVSADFSKAIKDFATVMSDLKRLSALGDLPVDLADKSTIRVRFPGCDADIVERLCLEVDVKRGIVGQDEDFEKEVGTEMALLFPFAPSETESTYQKRSQRIASMDEITWNDMLSPIESPPLSPLPYHGSDEVSGLYDIPTSMDREIAVNPWLDMISETTEEIEGNQSSKDLVALTGAESEGDSNLTFSLISTNRNGRHEMPSVKTPNASSKGDGEGMDGIYQFLDQCDKVTLGR